MPLKISHDCRGIACGLLLLVYALGLARVSAAQEDYSGLEDEDGTPSVAMTYDQALAKAQKGQADSEVLEVFRKSYDEVKGDYYTRKTNLAAILLDVANKIGEPSVWKKMYQEAQKLSTELLAVNPNDTTAQANLKAATGSLEIRTKQLNALKGPGEGLAGDNEVKNARQLIEDEDDDDDDDDDQEGDSDAKDGATMMTYAQALKKAQEGQADNEVLAVFRKALEYNLANGTPEQIKELKINLSALLLDVAKNEAEPKIWKALYAECKQLSEEILENFPDDDAAQANRRAADAWVDHRTQALKKMEEAQFLSQMSEPTPSHPPSPPSDGLSDTERARNMILDDDDDEDDEKDEL